MSPLVIHIDAADQVQLPARPGRRNVQQASLLMVLLFLLQPPDEIINR